MRLLIDSHALLWILSSPQQLSTHARSALGDPANERFVSVAALWEIAIKVSVGKLSIPMTLDAAVIFPQRHRLPSQSTTSNASRPFPSITAIRSTA